MIRYHTSRRCLKLLDRDIFELYMSDQFYVYLHLILSLFFMMMWVISRVKEIVKIKNSTIVVFDQINLENNTQYVFLCLYRCRFVITPWRDLNWMIIFFYLVMYCILLYVCIRITCLIIGSIVKLTMMHVYVPLESEINISTQTYLQSKWTSGECTPDSRTASVPVTAECVSTI